MTLSACFPQLVRQRRSRLAAVGCCQAFLHLPAERSRRRNHDRPEPPDGGGAGGYNDGAEEGHRTEEGRGGANQVGISSKQIGSSHPEICSLFSEVLNVLDVDSFQLCFT